MYFICYVPCVSIRDVEIVVFERFFFQLAPRAAKRSDLCRWRRRLQQQQRRSVINKTKRACAKTVSVRVKGTRDRVIRAPGFCTISFFEVLRPINRETPQSVARALCNTTVCTKRPITHRSQFLAN